MSDKKTIEALIKILKLLKPLTPLQRRRVLADVRRKLEEAQP